MSEMMDRCVEAMRAKRRELIAQPLERIWPDLMRAALEAMREPTNEMVGAAWAEAMAEDANGVWKNMIDEALRPASEGTPAVDQVVGRLRSFHADLATLERADGGKGYRIVAVGQSSWQVGHLAAVPVDQGKPEEAKKADDLNAPVEQLVGVVMANSGGSADPKIVEKVIRALRGERVSFVELPRSPD